MLAEFSYYWHSLSFCQVLLRFICVVIKLSHASWNLRQVIATINYTKGSGKVFHFIRYCFVSFVESLLNFHMYLGIWDRVIASINHTKKWLTATPSGASTLTYWANAGKILLAQYWQNSIIASGWLYRFNTIQYWQNSIIVGWCLYRASTTSVWNCPVASDTVLARTGKTVVLSVDAFSELVLHGTSTVLLLVTLYWPGTGKIVLLSVDALSELVLHGIVLLVATLCRPSTGKTVLMLLCALTESVHVLYSTGLILEILYWPSTGKTVSFSRNSTESVLYGTVPLLAILYLYTICKYL